MPLVAAQLADLVTYLAAMERHGSGEGNPFMSGLDVPVVFAAKMLGLAVIICLVIWLTRRPAGVWRNAQSRRLFVGVALVVPTAVGLIGAYTNIVNGILR